MIQFKQPNNKAKKIMQKKTIDISTGLGLKSANGINNNIRYGTSSAVQSTPQSVKSLPNMHMAQSMGAEGISMGAPSFYSPLHTAQNWQNPSKKREIYQYCRFYYSIQPKVAAAIDFYSQFSLHSGFILKCKSKKMITYYNHLCDKLKIKNVCKKILFQYFLIGDVYPFKSIQCKHCNGTGYLADGGQCNHPGGSFKSIILLNPDCIQVQKDAFTHQSTISMIPDDQLRMKVSKRHLYPNLNKIDPRSLKLILSGQPIKLSSNSVSHIKHGQKDYATYGQPIMKRLFMILNYKQKLMSANWVIAQRLILPLRLVKVGTETRPATSQQIADLTAQITQTANDPNLTLVTHHAVEYDWIGACYSDDTQILTQNGWKLFKDLNKKQKVGTYNQKTGFMQMQVPTEHYVYDFNSNQKLKMFNFKSKFMDILVTPNHRMLVNRHGKLQQVKSQEVQNNDKIINSFKWSGEIPNYLPYKQTPLFHMELNEYLKLCGYYLSEGTLKKQQSNSKIQSVSTYGITIYQNLQGKYCEDIRNITNLAYKNTTQSILKREKRTYTDCSFTINNKEIGQHFQNNFGSLSKNKFVPQWIKNLPPENLYYIFQSMMNGDGDITGKEKYKKGRYSTTSKLLADDFSQICMKLGYSPIIKKEKRTNKFKEGIYNDIYRVYFTQNMKNKCGANIRSKRNTKKSQYNGKVYCVSVPNTWLIIRRNGIMSVCGNTGKIQAINTQFEMIGKEILDGMMLSQALLNGQGPSASGVQAGLQCMIARLQSARDQLKDWIQEQVFKPIAQMNGFIDQEATKQLQSVTNNKNDIVYLYPKFVWNDLNLRDDSQKRQLDLQLFDKQLISRQQLLRGFEYDYDQMVEQMRQQAIITAQNGQMAGQPQQGGGGGMGDMGGMGGGGMGGGDMGAPPPPQGDMGQPPMGDMAGAGGAGGGQSPPMNGDMSSPPPATANTSSPIKIGRRGDKKNQPPQQQPPLMKNVQLTGLQQKTLKAIKTLNIPYQLFLQYKVSVPGNNYPYVMDFAWPKVGVSVQADGAKWHSDQQSKIKNAQRDQKLANIGWTVLRFKQQAINDKITQVQKIIYNNISQAAKRHQQQKKKASFDAGINKIASKLYNTDLIDMNSFNQDQLQYQIIDMPNNLGKIINIGIK